MLNEKLQDRIDLLEDQLEDIERSGFYSEKQIDLLSASIRYDLRVLQNASALSFLSLRELRELQNQINEAIVHLKLDEAPLPLFKKINQMLNDYFFPNPLKELRIELLNAPIQPEKYLQSKLLYNENFGVPSDILRMNVVNPEIITPNNPKA